jgi:hypothetical protein
MDYLPPVPRDGICSGVYGIDDTRKVSADGVISLSAVPFQTGADAIFDHVKYFAASHGAFRCLSAVRWSSPSISGAAAEGEEQGAVVSALWNRRPGVRVRRPARTATGPARAAVSSRAVS